MYIVSLNILLKNAITTSICKIDYLNNVSYAFNLIIDYLTIDKNISSYSSRFYCMLLLNMNNSSNLMAFV